MSKQLFKLSFSSALTITVLASCTSVDDSLTAEEQANLEASQNFASQNGDLDLSPDGEYGFKGQKLEPAAVVNGQSVYEDLNIGGADYTIITTEHNFGISLYALSADDQFFDIGHAQTPITDPSGLSSVQFAGKYSQREIDASGAISPELSAAIVLEFNPDAGTLDAAIGPDINYEWDAANQNFAGTQNTQGTAFGYEDNSILGNYNLTEDQTQTFGTFWAQGE